MKTKNKYTKIIGALISISLLAAGCGGGGGGSQITNKPVVLQFGILLKPAKISSRL